MVLTLLGGVGVFLVGMTLLTDGLKVAAGGALRGILARFTRNRFSAVGSGALVTALVQSSSATTLATIGFVSAGLLTFPQAVGVIFGANVGTTSTGWLVSGVGFKTDVSAIAFPFIGVGALLMLLTSGSRAAVGTALAGFGLIFVGIDFLQEGMADLANDIDPGTFHGETFTGRLLLVGLGLLMTVLMQSSSAAIATTLTALNAGAVDMNEAAALVIGQNLGTTVTAVIAALGASTAARRTALAHTLFNGLTAVIALAALPLFVWAATEVVEDGDPALSLAAFHTVFNLAGVALLLPFIGHFSALVARVVPERGPVLTADLDPRVAEVPSIGIDAARRTAGGIALVTLGQIEAQVRGAGGTNRLAEAAAALNDLRHFIARIEPSSTGQDHRRYLALLHAVDHLHQLIALAERPPPRAMLAEVDREAILLADMLAGIEGWLSAGAGKEPPLAQAETVAEALTTWRIQRRRELLEAAALPKEEESVVEHFTLDLGDWRARLRRRPRRPAPRPRPAPELIEQLDAMVWIARAAHHGWRLAWHLSLAGDGVHDGRPEVAFEPA
jgi:phosphate:Na+ symporter